MSNLLEEAIIDAIALKETALKSAEAALIEKYKEQYEETVKKLLEQEDLNPSSIPPEGATAPADVDSGVQAADAQQEPGGESFKSIPSSFLDGDDDELIEINFDKIEKQLQDVISPTLLATPQETDDESSEELPTDQEVEQPEMQQLEEDLELFEASEDEDEEDNEEDKELDVRDINKNGKKDDWEIARARAIAKNKKETNQELELELEEEYDQDNKEGLNLDALTEEDDGAIHITLEDENKEELEEVQAGQNYDEQIARKKQELAAIESQKAKAEAEAAKATQKQDDTISEEEIQELDEELQVDIDIDGLLSGYMGGSSAKKKELRNLELAAARDASAEEERKKQEQEVADLKNQLKESEQKNKKFFNLISELKQNLNSLREHTEKLSVSNAKLLYINKVFGNNSLNERQKEQIVESISRAESVLEAKTIYGTLQSTVQSVKNDKRKESLSEALNRGSSAFITRPKISSLDDRTSDRMKILAGIIKD